MQTGNEQRCARCGSALLESESFLACPVCHLINASVAEFGPATARGPFSPGDELGTAPLQRIGEYEILGEIARGGMGMVYKARQPRLNRTVALKVMLPGVIATRAQVQRFNAEAQIVAALNHPNIISIYEVGEDSGTYFFSMPLVNGVDLSKKGRVDARTAARYVRKVSEAVYHAHQRGVLHRDLKPNNVLIDELDEPRVVDFGIAKITAENQMLTQTGESLGTPSYMAPEQVHPDGDSISVATDIYALGGILYFLLTGRPPFEGKTRDQILWSVFYEEPESPAAIDLSIPRDLETICLKCLSKEPGQRYATAGQLAEDLAHYLAGEPISARPVSTFQRCVMWGKRNPALALSISALILALVYGVLAQEVALRKARKARADAEGLIEFMDKELAKKLRPLGRLDLTGDVVRKAEEYFRDQDEANSGPDFLLRKASFFSRAASLQRDLGKLPEAEDMALKGLSALERFQKDGREHLEARSLRAALNLLLFRVAEARGRRAEAGAYAKNALTEQRRAVDLSRGDAREIAALADVLMESGRFQREERNLEQGAAFLQEAAEHLKKVTRQYPADLEARRLLAVTHYHQALAFQDSRDNEAALGEFNSFVQELEGIAHAAAEDRDWQYELAVGYGRAASAQFALGSLQACEALVAKWRDAAQKLADFDPNNVLWRASYAQSLAWSGLVARDQAETDPRAEEYFGKSLEVYEQLSVQAPHSDQYLDRIEEISANLVRFYKAIDQPGDAEEVLRACAARQLDFAARFPDRFPQQKRLVRSFESLLRFCERERGPAEASHLCQTWLKELETRFAQSPAPYFWHWPQSAVHGFQADLAAASGKYDEAAAEWRRSVQLAREFDKERISGEIAEDLANAYKSLVSVENRRRDLDGFLGAASEAIDWLQIVSPRSPDLAADLSLFICNKAVPIDDGSDRFVRLLSRCRSALAHDSSASQKFDLMMKERSLSSLR